MNCVAGKEVVGARKRFDALDVLDREVGKVEGN